MKEKFVKIKTINNSGSYQYLSNTCFFISISDVIRQYGVNIDPLKLREIFKFKGSKNDLFDTDLHLDNDFTEGLRRLNLIILIYPYCPKFGAINSEIYSKLNSDRTSNELIIPIVCYRNVHFEPITDTFIPVYEEFSCKNIINEHIIIPTKNSKSNKKDIDEDEVKSIILYFTNENKNLIKKIGIIKNYVRENYNLLKSNNDKYEYIKEKYNKIKNEIEENNNKLNKLRKLVDK